MSLNVIPTNSESTKIKCRIPEYAKDFKREWQYIRGINQKCANYLLQIDSGGNIFNNCSANNLKSYIKIFLKNKECGKLKDICGCSFNYFDVNYIEKLEKKLLDYFDVFYSSDSIDFDEEYFSYCLDSQFIGYKEFLELIILINDKIKRT